MKRISCFLILFSVLTTACGVRKNMITKRSSTSPPPARNEKVVTPSHNSTGKYTASEYIGMYKDIAIRQMNDSGIPASITLAQGILESGSGNSTLARQANNHFGIKCTAEWKGKTILKDDDKRDDCFRVYRSAEDSFKDHSEFLKRKRYASLFELDKDDYRSWAVGLKAAGYATNPRYAELLISLIERYELHQYDKKEGKIEKIKREEKVLADIAQSAPEERNQSISKTPVSMNIYEVRSGDTLYSIARRFNLTINDLQTLNGLNSSDIKTGQLLLVSK
jgi:hypothetical protein